MEMNPKVAIIHPWMPQYRTAFFNELNERLAERDIDLKVFFGDTPPEWRARNDSAVPPGMVRLPTRFIRLGNRVIGYKALSAVRASGPYDLLIVEQAVRNIETYKLLATRPVRTRIAYWGHGRTYTASKAAIEETLKAKMTLRSEWFFGYTAGGVNEMVRRGFPAERTTVVQNSIDTTKFRRNLQSISDDEVSEFKTGFGFSDATCLYIGGVDNSKRIDFLIQAGQRIFEKNSMFKLMVVGAGDQLDALTKKAAELPWLTVHGPLFDRQKAIVFRAARMILNPGRVGLVAVDSLTAGVPIVTTDWPFHAPEFEYLNSGETMLVTANSSDDYADTVLRALDDDALIDALSQNCLRVAGSYSIEAMAERFKEGIVGALATR